jgi:hypothetical protein
MKDFKYLSSLPYTKKEPEDRHIGSRTLRRSLDLPNTLKFQRNMKTAELNHEGNSLAFPFFRPRSPVTSLAKSLQISKLSNTLNNISSDSPTNKPNNRVHSVLQSSQFMDLVNPHTPFKGSFLVIKKSEFSGTAKKKRFYHSINVGHKIRMSKTVKIESISIRDIRDKKWISKKINSILHDFHSILNKSNGIKIVKNIDFTPLFRYHVGKGNNSKLIKDLMSKRPGWQRTKSEDFNQVHFIWTEWLEPSIISQLPSINTQHFRQNDGKHLRSYQYKQSNFKRFLVDISPLGFHRIASSEEYQQLQETLIYSQDVRVYSKLKGNHHLSNKKELFYNLEKYCLAQGLQVFDYVPLTFHITSPSDPKLKSAEKSFNAYPNSLWILKPGEDTNRGSGIVICNSWDQIKRELVKGSHTFILQKYIENPFLIHRRKFDIRLYCLITCFNGVIQGYYYNEGYLRTSSKFFSLNLTDKFIHLTNDAIQKRSEDYGKFENGNKMSYNEFQKYLENHTTLKAFDFNNNLLPKIKEIVGLTIKSTADGLLDDKKNFTFEVFGYDFLVDADFRPWLLEVNTNPCLEISSSHLARIIPAMLENVFQLTLDSIFQCSSRQELFLTENRFELIFSSESSSLSHC